MSHDVLNTENFTYHSVRCDECGAKASVNNPWHDGHDINPPHDWSRRYVSPIRGVSLVRDLCPVCSKLHLALSCA